MRAGIRKLAALILLLISVSLLSSFVSSLNFSKTGFEGFIGEGFHGNQSGDDYRIYASAGYDQGVVGGGEGLNGASDMSSSFNPPNLPLFFVEGLDNTTNYLRLYTASRYVGGEWMADEMTCSQTSSAAKVYKVTPIVNLTDYLPVAKDTKAVFPAVYNCYDADSGTFSVKSTRQQYYGSSDARKVKPTTFDGTAFYPDKDIRELAERITANATTDYEMVELIQRYLRENYQNAYAEAVESIDPVKHFLFVTKKGTCREFASAFVLLAQSLGIPARLVFGYVADPVPHNQTVFASDACFWAEVKFKEGWVEFDPTPPSIAINTSTEITYVDSKIVGGEKFRIEGYVKAENEQPVSGFVEVFFKKDKREDGILVGLVEVKNSVFSAMLVAPNVTGEYNVVAHYVGSKYFAESWSDPLVKVYYKPHINVTIPDRIATNAVIEGSIATPEPYNGYIRLCVDSGCRAVEVRDGSFSAELSLKPGNVTLSIIFDGHGFVLPAKVEKEVEVGVVSVVINDTVVEGGSVEGVVTFNGKPDNVTVVLNGVKIESARGLFEANLPLKLGKNVLSVQIPDFLYRGSAIVYMKRPVVIEAEMDEGLLRVYVHDSDNNPADGYVSFAGETKELRNGRAEFALPDDFSSGKVVYHGSEKYLAAVKEVGFEFPWYLLLAAAIVAGAAVYFLAFRKRVESLHIHIEKEHPELPNVWEPGEVIRVELELPATLEVDGKKMGGRVFQLKFKSPGLKKIVAERRDGGIRGIIRRGEVSIRIAPYGEGIAEVLKMLEGKLNSDTGHMTAREVARALGLKDSKIIRYFELAKYKGVRFSRKEFVEAFYEYLKVVGDEAS